MPLDIEAVCVEPLTDLHVRKGFRCQDRGIQNFCRGRLADAHRESTIRAFVAVEDGARDVLGFYYLVTTSVEHDQVGREVRDGFMDLEKIPAIYLGMIGVHRELMRQGIGTVLMRHAFGQVRKIAESAGVWALTLDAIDQDAASYYERFDFKRFSDGGLEMYLPLGVILALGLD